MKQYLLLTFLAVSSIGLNAQSELSMAEVEGQYIEGVYRYIQKGEKEPYTGYLYAKYDNGNFNSYQYFVEGIGQGTWYNYYENGNVKEEGTYKDNRVEGAIKKYYTNGKLKSEGTYREWRIRIGVWKYYNESGELLKTEDYGQKGDYRDVEEYYKNGEISDAFYQKLLKG